MLFSQPTSDQAIALAGVFHCAELVDKLAHNGYVSELQLGQAMTALLNQNPQSVMDLYGDLDNLELGMTSMRAAIEQDTKTTTDVMRYVIGIMYLARKLTSDKKRLTDIGEGIEIAGRQAEVFTPMHDNVVANIASLYSNTISTLPSRIKVRGNPLYLKQTAVAQRTRCLLFSGIRSAFLWHQLGGKRRHLLWQRKLFISVMPEK
ncbi:high frequency lysogenization protein HflD [Porticoccaceae bacterium]|nr:high frequency lysogenization protein HflD [Porticoccaceae bacterium]MDA8681088.1 high frequency lysogenization protein HflD [Porticoccaceae bacterium]MDB2635181.1 high frequency lysogenization protein HflD [Porticoccaceae bacterium]MDB2664186.1 high frequency lysogenization protein HflD [Porticoccaceae bacterium]